MNQNRTIQKINNGPFITYILIAINIAVFILMSLTGGTENVDNLIAYGAKFNPLIVSGEWWRLITPMFIHIGIMHILLNMVTLYFMGLQLEPIFGHTRFLIIYFFSGLAGNIASFSFNQGISAGASTALFGLFGASLMLGYVFKHNPYFVGIAKQFGLFVLINLVFNLFDTSVDISGHLGGLIGGFLVAYICTIPRASEPTNLKRILVALVYLVLAVLFIYIGFKRFVFTVY